MAKHRIASVSVDLDPLRCYYGIHGLGPVPAAIEHVVLRRALPRFAELFARRKITATFFVVGEDLEKDPAGRSLLGDLSAAGHELGNHSWSHPYELARLPRAQIRDEVTRCGAALRSLGAQVVGFRAPGYDVSAELHDVLVEAGYRYDSSVFPSWPYYAAKAGVMAAMALVGKSSKAVLGDPRALLAPSEPYRPGRSPFFRGQSMLVELPITVTPFLRLPVHGTALVLAPVKARALLLEAMRRRHHFNLELHGIDLIGAEEDGIPAELVAQQPDLRVSLADKLRALEASLDRLAYDFTFEPLRDVAARTQRGEIH